MARQPPSGEDHLGKAALVASGCGLGAPCARRLAADVADVAITSLNNEHEADEVVQEVRSLGRRSEFCRADQAAQSEAKNLVHGVVDDFGRIDILVNSAGIFVAARWELSPRGTSTGCRRSTSTASPGPPKRPLNTRLRAARSSASDRSPGEAPRSVGLMTAARPR